MKKVFKANTDPEKIADIILALIRTQAEYSNTKLSKEYKDKLDQYNKEYWEEFYNYTEWIEE